MIMDDDNEDIINEKCSEYIDKFNYLYWVFSYGGCGTNYMRKVLKIIVKKKPQKDSILIRSIHIFYPPKINKSKFMGIFIYDDPCLCIHSIFRRKLHLVINILSGKEIYKDAKEVNLHQFVNDFDYDILRIETMFNNWLNSKTSYSILFINYSKLKNNINKINKEFNLNISNKNIKSLRSRARYEKIIKLEKIYENMNNKINNLPDYFVKY